MIIVKIIFWLFNGLIPTIIFGGFAISLSLNLLVPFRENVKDLFVGFFLLLGFIAVIIRYWYYAYEVIASNTLKIYKEENNLYILFNKLLPLPPFIRNIRYSINIQNLDLIRLEAGGWFSYWLVIRYWEERTSPIDKVLINNASKLEVPINRWGVEEKTKIFYEIQKLYPDLKLQFPQSLMVS